MHTSEEVTSFHELQHNEEKRRCVLHFLCADNTGLVTYKACNWLLIFLIWHNFMFYLYNCWVHNWIEYSLSLCKVRMSEAEAQSWFTLPVLNSVHLVCRQPDVFDNKTQVMTSFKRVIVQIFGAKYRIMGGGSWLLILQEGFGKFSWFSHPTKSSVTHMSDFLQDILFSVCISEEFWVLPDCLHSKHFSHVLWTKEAHQQLKEDLFSIC